MRSAAWSPPATRTRAAASWLRVASASIRSSAPAGYGSALPGNVCRKMSHISLQTSSRMRTAALARYRSELGKGIARRRQRRAREPRVLVDPAHKVLDAVEFELGPDPIDEGDVDDLAVKITRKIEQEDFEQHRALVEHRPPSEACDAVVAALANAHPHRVDAVLEAAGGVET